MDARIRHLLDRELDGALTPTERAELARARRASRPLDREARAWARVERDFVASLDAAPPLALDRIAAAVSRRATRQSYRRPMVAAASLVILGALAAAGAVDRPAPGASGLLEPTGARTALAQAPVAPTPPVEVNVDAASESGALLRIEF